MNLLYVLVILHALAAVVFFGPALVLAGLARGVVAHTGEARAALHAQGARIVRLMTYAGLAAAVLAYATFALGMSQGRPYGWPYHASATLILVLLAVHVFGTVRAWKALADGPGADAARGKVAAFTGVAHLVWLLIFVLMFMKYFVPSAYLMG